MKNKNPLDRLLVEMTEMIELIQSHRGTISAHITPEVLKKLENLEETITSFEEINQQAFREAGVDIDKLKQEKLTSSDPLSKENSLLQRANQIASTAHNLQLVLSREMKEGRSSKKPRKSPSSNLKRKKRFKPLGGETNWIPL